jgi:hypothetical protein
MSEENKSPAPTKEGLEEAKEIIDDLLMNIPAQTEDQDWWESGLVKAVERAKAYIAGAQSSLQPSSPDPTILVQALEKIATCNYLNASDGYDLEGQMMKTAQAALNKYKNK